VRSRFAKQLVSGPFHVVHFHDTVAPSAGNDGVSEAVPLLQYPDPIGNSNVPAGKLSPGKPRLSLAPQIGCRPLFAKQVVFGSPSRAGQIHETVCPTHGKDADPTGEPSRHKVSLPNAVAFQSYVFVAVPQMPAPCLDAVHSAESLPPFRPRHTQRAVSPGAGKNVNDASPAAH